MFILVSLRHSESYKDIEVNSGLFDYYSSFWPSCFFYLCTLLPITWTAEWTLLEGRRNNATEDKQILSGVSDPAFMILNSLPI